MELFKVSPVKLFKVSPMKIFKASPVELFKVSPVELSPVELFKAYPVELFKVSPEKTKCPGGAITHTRRCSIQHNFTAAKMLIFRRKKYYIFLFFALKH